MRRVGRGWGGKDRFTIEGGLLLFLLLGEQGVLEPEDLTENHLLQSLLHMLDILLDLQRVAVDLLEHMLLQSGLQQIELGVHKPVNLRVLRLVYPQTQAQ